MDTKIYGLDFGTSNSAISILENGEARVLPIGPNGQKTIRSVLFFPKGSSDVYVGEEAILKYVSSGMNGRLLQSIKSALSDEGFGGTIINGKKYTIEDLISIMIRELKERADKIVGEEISCVILGRPAIFSDNPKKEILAQERLRRAAQMSGFENIYFQLEPIAAAYDYEISLNKDETVLVADLGGGTSDFTVIKLSATTHKSDNRRGDILSTGGVYIGGDDFDSEIMSNKMLPYFGSLSSYKSGTKWLHIPNRLTTTLCDWRRISFLKGDKDEMKLINEIMKKSNDKESIIRLNTLVTEDLGFSLFQEIEKAKIGLSNSMIENINFHKSDIEIEEKISREEFELFINNLIKKISVSVDETLYRSKLKKENIDSVFLTGGTTYVPSIRKLFIDKFGKDKVKQGDAFISVTKGLALSGLWNK